MKAEKRYFIYVYHQLGNIGRYEILLIEDQPKEGFLTEAAAEDHLVFLAKEGKNYWFERDWCKFIVTKTFVLIKSNKLKK